MFKYGMYKQDQQSILKNKDARKRNQTSNRIKAADINILLNRVRLNKKNAFKKKMVLTFLSAGIVGLIIFFSII
tara:strand:+ start:94 stop:315 length:222 start_codon:yes stop_codon:yes gene_type:complete